MHNTIGEPGVEELGDWLAPSDKHSSAGTEREREREREEREVSEQL